MAALHRFPKLSALRAQAHKASDDTLAEIKSLPPLTSLRLDGFSNPKPIVGKVAAAIAVHPLKILEIHGAEIGIDLAGAIAQMPTLKTFTHGGSTTSLDVLREVARSASLTGLWLHSPAITDEGLELLAQLKTLRKIDVRECNVTAPGVKKFAERLPSCEIIWDGGHIKPMAAAGAAPATIEAAADRQVAEWVRQVSSYSRLDLTLADGSKVIIQPGQSLPSTEFRVIGVIISAGNSLSDEDVARFKELSSLQRFTLTGPIGDEAFRHLAAIESLRTIAVNGSRGTATGFELLARVPALDILHAQDSSITDEALASIVAVQPKLRWLYLQRTQVTDVGLAHLVRLKSLQWVYLNGTKVTASGLAAFRKARPDIKTVESDFPDEPNQNFRVSRLAGHHRRLPMVAAVLRVPLLACLWQPPILPWNSTARTVTSMSLR
jgi:hypothetical protein